MPATEPAAAGHVFLTGARRRDRAACLAGIDLPAPLMPTVDAHRRLRGPYTAAGTLLRAIVPIALTESPGLVAAHEVEILSVSPELRQRIPATIETLTSLAVPEERTRFYSRFRTLRIAHGLAEFVRDFLIGQAGGPRSVVFDAVEHADPTDQEFIAVLLRRVDPGLLTVVAGGTEDLLGLPDAGPYDPETPNTESLSAALTRFCRRVTAAATPDQPATEPATGLAARYVESDGTSDEPAVLAAYRKLPVEDRQALHDRRADELAALGERSLALGAIAYHRELGGDPVGAGAYALADALEDCMNYGFYDAAVDLCFRGRAITTWDEHPELRWAFTRKLPTSLAALGRAGEIEAYCDEARANSTEPEIHLMCAYATAMLYTRHREQRDHERARAWINEAIAFAMLQPDVKLRAFHQVFHNNGLALIEAHRKRPERALALVTAGMAELDRHLGPDEHQLHRSVLLQNRAQVLAGLGRLGEALADYRAVAAVDPYYPEYHFELANVLAKLDQTDEALAEYNETARLGPPFPELFYNRGDLWLDMGDEARAMADFAYVLELDPLYLPAYVNLAGIHLDRADLDAAQRMASDGLAQQPDNPDLLAVLGHVHLERGAVADASAAFDRALAVDADLVAALSGRAAIAHRNDDPDGAIGHLTHAIGVCPDEPALRYNRAMALRDVGRLADALDDLAIAAQLAPDDEDVLAAQREWQAGHVPA